MSHTQDKSSAFRQGVLIFVYLTVLTALEYFVAIKVNAVSILVVVAVIKAALVMYYYMHIYMLNAENHEDERSYEYKTGTNRLGLWLFLLSDSFVFAGLMTARINLLGLTRPHLNQLLGLAVTAVLLLSSFFMNRGETAMAHGDKKGFMNNTLVTFVLGLGFLLGVVLVEWRLAAEEGLVASFGSPATGPMGAVFYMMTGMHAFHVFTGLIFLLVVWNNARKDLYSAEKHWGVEAATVYWHFVDLVWIFFYPALYLIGKLL
ncbi:MAG TPA: cytochrome c oxidase subunit 3 [Anaerolineales bacterium]|nr:cytochrome c oxidase subunit 3 [Anaerolineales bacterium]